MIYGFIKENSKYYPVVKMCQVFKISSKSYYSWFNRKPSKRKERLLMLEKEITKVYWQYKCRYGSPRICKELNMLGIKVSERLVAQIMRKLCLKSIARKKFKTTTDSNHSYSVSENKLNRMFKVDSKNKVWVSDITYIPTQEGWLYLTTVIDLFNRKVIGWALSSGMKADETIIPAFNMAIKHSSISTMNQLLFHSDRGVQYACNQFKSYLKKTRLKIETSMSRKGNCWDNAVAESFFKTLKTELIYRSSYQIKKEAELDIFEYIETFYNTKRRHKHLNNLTILEFNQLNNNNLKNAA